jgi:thiamine biosynthesis lipoprotein
MQTRCEARLEVMGTIAHVIAIGDAGTDLVEHACVYLRDLEARWSRFDPSSEISQLNASEGIPLVVSAPTVALIQLGIEGWRITDGRFDPTVLGDVTRCGYDRSYCDITDETARCASSSLRRGCSDIEVDSTAGIVRLPVGVGVDPGGIGKGLAADLAVDELLASGASGACVNVGGDLRVTGTSPGDGWVIEVSCPRCNNSPSESVRLVDGAIATSGSMYRSWIRDGERKHHLIDPRTGEPIDNDIATVSVAAARGWQADLLTKAIFVAGVVGGLELAEELDAAALVVTDNGVRHANSRWCDLAEPSTGPPDHREGEDRR